MLNLHFGLINMIIKNNKYYILSHFLLSSSMFLKRRNILESDEHKNGQIFQLKAFLLKMGRPISDLLFQTKFCKNLVTCYLWNFKLEDYASE